MNENKQRVLLGMSGGVDSSVAGYLLREQGYEVIGVTMKVWPQDCISRAEDKCCGPQAVADARGVAHALGIPHYVVDEADQFEQLVIDYFSSEYQAGRTPNPCVMCNEKLKFGNLWSKAEALGCDYIATGHYAIIEHAAATGATAQLRGFAQRDRSAKRSIVFSFQFAAAATAACTHAARPDGEAANPRDRRNLGLKVADKADSQEICFVPGQGLQSVPAFASWRKPISSRRRFTIWTGNFIGDTKELRCLPLDSARGCRAVRRSRVTSSISIRKRTA